MGVVCAVGVVSSASAQRDRGPIRLEEVGEAGCASCADVRLLSNVLDVVLGRGDSLMVLDATRPKVRIFRRDGRRIASHVAEGREPGQAVLPVGLVIAAGRSRLIDGVLDRVTVFDSAWTYVTHQTLPAQPVAVAHLRPFDHYFVATVDYASGTPTIRVWRGDTTDTTLRLVHTFADGFPRDRTGKTTSFFGFAMAPDGGFVVGEGAYAYRVRRYDQDGNLVTEIERDVPRATMTEAEHARALERRRMALRRAASLARAAGGDPGIGDELPLEHNHFSAAALRYDQSGRLWIKTDRGGEGRTVFDVFDSAGTRYAEVTVPAPIGRYDVSEGHLAGLTLYAMGVPVIKVYRILETRRR